MSRTHLTLQLPKEQQPGTNPCGSACSWHQGLELLEPPHAKTCQGHCCPICRVGVSLPTLSFLLQGAYCISPQSTGVKAPFVNVQHRIPPIHSCIGSVSANSPCQGSLSHTFARQNSSASLCPSSHLPRKEPLGTQIHARMGGTAASSP